MKTFKCSKSFLFSKFFPFLGQKFAFTEQKIVLAKMFRRYRFIAHQHELESRGLPELILKPSHGFVIRVERRKQ